MNSHLSPDQTLKQYPKKPKKTPLIHHNKHPLLDFNTKLISELIDASLSVTWGPLKTKQISTEKQWNAGTFLLLMILRRKIINITASFLIGNGGRHKIKDGDSLL